MVVEVIGIVTLIALVWVLESSMVAESEADRRRRLSAQDPAAPSTDQARSKHAA